MQGIIAVLEERVPVRHFSWFLLIGVLFWAAPGVAQPFDLNEPVSSPRWWTLTDTLSPAELQQAWSDPEANLARYKAAMAAGLASQRDDEFLHNTEFYYCNPDLTPELTPMWEGFDVFGDRVRIAGAERILRELTVYGISESGRERILEVSREQHTAAERLYDKVAPDSREFGLLLLQIAAQRGTTGQGDAPDVRAALEDRDHQFFADATGMDPDRTAELLDAFRTSPGGHTAGQALVVLRSELAAADWEALRRYLLEVVAAGMGAFADFKL